MIRRAVTLGSLLLFLSACGDGSSPEVEGVDPATPPVGCTGDCADTPTSLSTTDVEAIIAQSVAEAQALGVEATIAVVDRVGNVLGVFRMNGAAMTITVRSPGGGVDGGLEGVNIVPDTLAAIAKATTAAAPSPNAQRRGAHRARRTGTAASRNAASSSRVA